MECPREANVYTDEYEFIRPRTGELTITAAYVQPEKMFIPETELLITNTKAHLIIGDLKAHNTSWGANRTNEMGDVVVEDFQTEDLCFGTIAKQLTGKEGCSSTWATAQYQSSGQASELDNGSATNTANCSVLD